MTTPAYPPDRAWALPGAAPADDYPELAAAWERSRVLHIQIRALLEQSSGRLPGVRAVAVSGSLGRMEAGPHADADLLVVADDDAPRDRAMAAVWDALAPLGLSRPKATGIFATPVSPAELLDPATVGRVVEDVGVFGKRIQLLLDAQPVYGFAAHERLTRAVAERYLAGGRRYLLNDLIRYYRSLCLEAQWDFGDRGMGWYGRDLKLRHSRAVMYAALLLLIGEVEGEDDPAGWLAARLARTPLERLAGVYAAHGDPRFGRVATVYDRFVAATGDGRVRAELKAAAPAGPADLDRPPPSYVALSENARELTGELARFVLARGGRFVDDVLF